MSDHEPTTAENPNAPLLLESLIEQSHIAVVVADRGGDVVYANSGSLELMDWDRTEPTGRHLLLETQGGSLLVDGSEPWMAAWSGATWVGELQLRNGRGDELVLSARVSPIVDATGGVTHVMVSMEDASDQLRDELLFRSVVESAPDAMVIADGNGIVRLVNAQFEHLVGYQR
ncbi:MAG: PAS domain-containing protein, partial [Acidimicrobiales bacterium]